MKTIRYLVAAAIALTCLSGLYADLPQENKYKGRMGDYAKALERYYNTPVTESGASDEERTFAFSRSAQIFNERGNTKKALSLLLDEMVKDAKEKLSDDYEY